jgi:BASS family bile acid:Na+ symporter
MRPAEVLESYSHMMVLGLVLGLLLGGFPAMTKEISMASLVLLMTFSLANIRLGEAVGRGQAKDAAVAFVLNYVVLSGVILAMGWMFSEEIWWGWVLMAAAPSAVSVVPFTAILGGRTGGVLFATAVNYVLALALMPLISLLFIGSAVSSWSLVTYLLVLIALPMALSRGVMRLGPSKRVSTVTMNLAFAVLIFAVAGSNRDAFFDDPVLVAAISVACIVRTFGTGLGTEYVLRALGRPKEERVGHVLFASYKNLGLTATLAIALFEPVVAVPATICIVFEVVWVIWLARFYSRVSPGKGATT